MDTRIFTLHCLSGKKVTSNLKGMGSELVIYSREWNTSTQRAGKSERTRSSFISVARSQKQHLVKETKYRRTLSVEISNIPHYLLCRDTDSCKKQTNLSR